VSGVRRAWSRLQVRLAALVVGLLVLGFGVAGVVQQYVLRQYLLGQAAQAALAQVGVAEKVWENDPGRQPVPSAVAGSAFAIYSADGRTLLQPPPSPVLGSKASQPWVEPPPPAMVAVAVALNSPNKQLPDDRLPARLLGLAGLGPLGPVMSNQQVLPGPGADVVLTAVPLGRDRLLVMETSLADTDAIVRADLRTLWLAAGVTLAATAILAVWLTSRSLAPLDRVSMVAGQIEAGAYDRRTGLRGHDQVAELGAAFDEMVDRLQEQIVLERDAEARTRRFLADASHELRTPMAALLGHVEVLRRGAWRDPANLERSLSATHTAALRMSRLLQELLEIARLEQPEHALRRERVEVAGVLSRAVRAAAASTGRHRVLIDPGGDRRLSVLGDGDAIERILVNLLDNAAGYSPAGTTIRVSAATTATGRVEIAVADQGPGVAVGERERIFERLYRGEHARAAPGAGLGLAICRALSRQQGGDVTLRSEPGAGSTFVLRLPACPDGTLRSWEQ
jgi:two-component system OmpR family sensor kinase